MGMPRWVRLASTAGFIWRIAPVRHQFHGVLAHRGAYRPARHGRVLVSGHQGCVLWPAPGHLLLLTYESLARNRRRPCARSISSSANLGSNMTLTTFP
jgi:hypothetical protein